MRPGIEDYFARSCYAAPDRIVIATALTDLEYLAPQAIAHAEAAHAELVFIHAIAPDAPPAKATFYNPLKADRDARLTLEVLARHVRARGIACGTAVRHGYPAEVLEDFLREKPAGRLMIGARATAEADSCSLGSTANQLLLQTPIPVCAFPVANLEDAAENEASRHTHHGLGQGSIEPLRAILYPVGQHGPHPEGMKFALDLAQYFHSELILLQIAKPGCHTPDSLPVPCAARLWPRVRRISGMDASPAGLLSALRVTGADMMLVEAPASLSSNESETGTLAELVGEAPCPVLTFPVLPWNRSHPELHVLSESHSDSTPFSVHGAQ